MKLETRPKHFLDFLLWPLLRIFWEPLSRKNSHWWHWLDYYGNVFLPLEINPVPSKEIRYSFWQRFYLTNFGWRKVVVVKPKGYTGGYRLGFISQTEKKKQVCAVILSGQAAALIGGSKVQFFAIDYYGREIPLELVEVTYNKATLPKEIILV